MTTGVENCVKTVHPGFNRPDVEDDGISTTSWALSREDRIVVTITGVDLV